MKSFTAHRLSSVSPVFGETNDTNRHSTPFSQYVTARPFLQRIAVVSYFALVALGLSIALTITFRDSADERSAASTNQERFAAAWQTRVSQRLGEAVSLAAACGTFAAAGAPGAPNHNGTVQERLQFINNDTWPVMAATLFEQVPGMLSVQLQPSGVIAQFWPPGSAPLGLDNWNRVQSAAGFRALIASRATSQVQGPFLLAQGGLGVVARFIVYLSMDRSVQNWWGAGVAVFRVDELLNAMNITQSCDENGYDFYAYALSVSNSSIPPQYILSNLDEASAARVAREGVIVRAPSVDPSNALEFAFAKRGGLPSKYPAGGVIAGIVIGCVLGAAVIVLIGVVVTYAMFVLRHSVVPRPAVAGAAEDTCMSLVSVKRMAWWHDHADPELLQADLHRFEQTVASVAASHGAYSSGRISDGCVLVVAKDAADLQAFGREVSESLAIEGTVKRGAATGRGGDDTHSMRSSRSRRSAATGQSKRSGTERSSESTTLHQPAAIGTTKAFEIGVTLHYGPLTAAYDAAADRFTFQGPAFTTAAAAVDMTRGGEMSVTETFADKFSVPLADVSRKLALDDDVALFVFTVRQLADASGLQQHYRDGAAGQPAGSGAKRGSDEDRSVATVVSTHTGAVLRKRIAVLAVEFLPPGSGEEGSSGVPSKGAGGLLPLPGYPDVIRDVEATVREFGGEVISVTDAMVLVAFNARVTATNVATRAIHLDEALRMQFSRFRLVSAIGTGFAHIATVDAYVMCIGSTVTRTRRLLMWAVLQATADAQVARDHSIVRGAEEANPYVRAPVVDLTSSETVREHFELQCLGPISLYRSLAYTVSREWAVDEDDDEWLYRLRKLEETSTYSALNGAFEALHGGDVARATTLAEQVFAAPDKRVFLHAALESLHRSLEAAKSGNTINTPVPV